MRSLPSLTALRAFETAARCGSFSLAAVELGVTAAAVSLQVKALEAELGRRLFLRQGNRILLTDAGRFIYPRLASAFKDLSEVVGLGDQARGRLVISVLPMLGPWVVSRLSNPSAAFEIRLGEDPVSLIKGDADIRITYGGHLYPDHRVTSLHTDEMVPVGPQGSPAPKDLPPDRFIHMNWGPGYGSLPGWAEWFSANGGTLPDQNAGWRVNDAALALALIRDGRGIALLPRNLVGRTEVLVLGKALPMPLPNVLVMLQARSQSVRLARIASLLGDQNPPDGSGFLPLL